jgi:type II secretory ATPase GspE/PulE/Tfp pilus assembly ATPase PilB-like protein
MSDRLAVVRARALAEAHGLPYVDLSRRALDPSAVRSVPLELLERLVALPYEIGDGVVHVALADPTSGAAEELQRASARPIAFAVARREEVAGLLHELAVGGTLREDDLRLEGDGFSDAPAIRAVNDVLRRAIEARASDIHLIPDRDYVHIRLRVDGVVEEHGILPSEDAQGVISRIKVLAELDVAERRRPQDGRFTVRTTSGRGIDARVTLLPTVAGEGVVMRLLEKTRIAPSLTDLGLENAMQMELERIVHRSVGALLVTGPTGSGKSTTLHGALADLSRTERMLITIEDPVEYELPGSYQLQTNAAAGVTFATALRSVLRGDPDVIMVGEIRDAETAELALGGSLAGHFVLSTLHTNDAASAILRLVEMGVEPYVVSAGLSGVLGQRLARRLCLYCRESYKPTQDVLDEIGSLQDDAHFFRAVGCRHCSEGHRGRVGIFQLLTIDDRLRSLIANRAPHDELSAAAEEAGLASLWTDGLAKVESGSITLEELRRTVPR